MRTVTRSATRARKGRWQELSSGFSWSRRGRNGGFVFREGDDRRHSGLCQVHKRLVELAQYFLETDDPRTTSKRSAQYGIGIGFFPMKADAVLGSLPGF